jgi:hypothetical protein
VIDHYDWAGGGEHMLRFGPDDGPVAVVALPLFEEGNRTRTFAVTLCRALAGHGVGSAIPDLPGQGESLVPTEQTDLSRIQAAYAGAVDALAREGRRAYAVAMRSGALIDAPAHVYGHWHLAPQSGEALLRELERIAGFRNDPDWWCHDETFEIAGNLISTTLLSALVVARPFEDRLGVPLRCVRLETDPEAADRKIDAAPLWRRAEPDDDPPLAALLADDIAQWIAQGPTACGG